MQENRSFDHYFGSMAGVRGFADPFPIPVPDTDLLQGKTVWYQRNDAATGSNPKVLAPQRNDTSANFALIRTAGTPHLYPDAQLAWDHGRLSNWPQYKNNPSMVYFTQTDIPFQFALANAFTICDDNHSAFTGGTNPNRCFFYTGTNHGKDDPSRPGVFNGPAMDNSYNALSNGAVKSGYTWMTYAERLEDAGVSWQVYQNEEVEFYALNSLLGFKNFRDANAASTPVVSPSRTPRQQALYEKGISTRDLDLLKADVIAGTLPQVSWICATSSGSEHPSASSPAQGAAYIARVLDALTANPDVWSKTVLIVNFDENDGFFDHVAPPAPPSYTTLERRPGAGEAGRRQHGRRVRRIPGRRRRRHPVRRSVQAPPVRPRPARAAVRDLALEQGRLGQLAGVRPDLDDPLHREALRRRRDQHQRLAPRGGGRPDVVLQLRHAQRRRPGLVAARHDRARRRQPRARQDDHAGRLAGAGAAGAGARHQAVARAAVRAARDGHVVTSATTLGAASVRLTFANVGAQAAVFQVYDRNNLTAIPRRYTVEAGKTLADSWAPPPTGAYDLWVLGPGGFHRHFTGNARRAASAGQPNPDVVLAYDGAGQQLRLQLTNSGPVAATFSVAANAYYPATPATTSVVAHGSTIVTLPLAASGGWYDFSARVNGQADWSRRVAGRMETGADSTSDPAMYGAAVGNQYKV